jgi:hypothetical protein
MLAATIESNIKEIELIEKRDHEWLFFNIARYLLQLAIMSYVTARLWHHLVIVRAQNILLKSPKYPGMPNESLHRTVN